MHGSLSPRGGTCNQEGTFADTYINSWLAAFPRLPPGGTRAAGDSSGTRGCGGAGPSGVSSDVEV